MQRSRFGTDFFVGLEIGRVVCYNTNMGQKKVMTNRQRMEDLLREISFKAGRQNLWESFNHDGFTGQPFDGELGDKVHFSGGFWHNKDREEDSYAKINLRCKDKQLARIEMEHGYIAPSAVYSLTDETNIKVISPRWKETYGVCDTTYNKDQKRQLSVLHSPDETADAVIAKIFDVIARSKDHLVIAQKLSKLNLPSKITIKNVDTLADNLVDQIRDTATKDSGREM